VGITAFLFLASKVIKCVKKQKLFEPKRVPEASDGSEAIIWYRGNSMQGASFFDLAF